MIRRLLGPWLELAECRLHIKALELRVDLLHDALEASVQAKIAQDYRIKALEHDAEVIDRDLRDVEAVVRDLEGGVVVYRSEVEAGG